MQPARTPTPEDFDASDLEALGGLVDYFSIMTYDFSKGAQCVVVGGGAEASHDVADAQ
jgi:GH18 family chitinase